jgi:hypothetical protein
MTRVALMIESDGGFKFGRIVEMPGTPRKGAKVDLGPFFGLKPARANRATISSIFQTVNGQGKVLETAVLFDADDDVSDEIMAEAIKEYNRLNPKD